MAGKVAAPGGQADAPRSAEPDEVMTRRIGGVRIERLAGYHDARGALVPFLDAAAPFWQEPIVWGYQFTIRPGRIKGWGMHERQADRYFVVAGDLRVVLYDGRDDSPDRGHFCEFYFADGGAGLLSIPPGVWHATQNWGESLGRIVNFPTRRFDPRDPDKFRLDPHDGSIPFDWRLKDG
ncbi:MAG TPA: dTDP-4-dehydrorhamnose 3,5-epimerase [Thermoanaerobaculia bacterium]